jgi:hypothetical protein
VCCSATNPADASRIDHDVTDLRPQQACRRARRDKRADRDLQRAVDHLLATAIPLLLRLPATAPPRDVADGLLDGVTLDDLPATQRDTAAAVNSSQR